MSNRDRIARAAEEAALAAAERKAARESRVIAAIKKAARESKAKPVRMKIVWDVCNESGKAVKTFPYPDKAAAEAHISALARSTGRTHALRPTKVPME